MTPMLLPADKPPNAASHTCPLPGAARLLHLPHTGPQSDPQTRESWKCPFNEKQIFGFSASAV